MRAVALAVVLMVVPSLAPVAFAKSSGPRKPRLMQVDIPADKTFDANTVKVINEFLAGALRDQSFQVITSEDIVTALGVDRQRQLLGCNESSCLAEIGGAMGADYLVHGNVAVLETKTAVTLTLTDAKGVALQQQRRLVPGRTVSDLLAAIEAMVPVLVHSVKPLDATATTPSLQATALEGPSRVPAYVTLGLAGALLVGAVASTAVTYGSFNNLKSNYTDAGASSLRNLDHLSDALWAGALVAGGIGTYLYFSEAPGAGGGGELGIRGSF